MTTLVIDLHDRRDHPDYDPDLNPNVIYVSRRQWWGRGRLLDAHPLNNPPRNSVKRLGSHEAAVAAYCRHLLDKPGLLRLVPTLHGRTLGCWCAPQLCHAHVLAALAGAPLEEHQTLLEKFTGDPYAALPAVV